MRRFLVVGCGGSGGATLAYLMDQLRSDLAAHRVNQLPPGWQFVHIDVPNTEEGGPEGLGNVEQQGGTYFGCSPTAIPYSQLDSGLSNKFAQRKALGYTATWAPKDPTTVTTPLEVGAGQFRAVGRMITLSRAQDIREKLESVCERLSSPDTTSAMRRLQVPGLGDYDNNTPIVLVISSMAGGAGASMALDVCRILSQIQRLNPKLTGLFMMTPDVFDKLADDKRTGVRANALAMLGEIVAAQTGAAHQHDAGTLKALGQPGGSHVKTPFARMFPVGRFVGDAADGRQFSDDYSPNAIFRGLGRGLAALMMSQDALEPFVRYDLGNTSSPPGDQSLLGWGADWDGLPWGSFGYASLSMGRDRYAEYSAQRMARSCVDRLLRGHLQSGNSAPSNEQAAALLESQWPSLCRRSGLPATLDEIDAWMRGFAFPTAEVGGETKTLVDRLFSQHIPDAGGAQAHQWLPTVRHRLGVCSGELTTSADTVAQQLVFRWHRQIIELVEGEVSRNVARLGLPYSVALVERLAKHLRDIIAPAAERLTPFPSPIVAVPDEVERMLAGAKGTISNGDHAMSLLRTGCQNGVHAHIHARAAELSASVLRQFSVDVLRPLAAALAEAQKILEEAMKTQAEDLGLARLATDHCIAWPADSDERVADRFDQADNELLLTSSEHFRGFYDTHLCQAPPKKSGDATPNVVEARALVTESIISGDWETTGGERPPGGLFEQTAPWRPRVFAVDPTSGEGLIPSLARYDVHVRPGELLERARLFVARPGESFDNFCRLSITEFVDGDSVLESERNARRRELIAKFSDALDQALPLTSVNNLAMGEVHKRNVRYRFKFSEIPFRGSIGDELRRVIANNSKIDDTSEENLKQAIGDTPGITRIDIFGSYPNYSPLVFDGVLRPVAAHWAEIDDQGRALWWHWRRARPLDAALPMAEVERRAMVAGWLLGLVTGRVSIPAAPYTQPVRIWDGGEEDTGWVAFPHPLLTPPSRFPGPYDWLPAVLESVLMAIARSHEDPLMSSLRPYRLLRGIWDDSETGPAGGGLMNQRSSRALVRSWLSGATVSGGPSSLPGVAEAETVEDRAQLAAGWLEAIQTLAGTHYMAAGDAPGAQGGGEFGEISSRRKASATPMFRDLAPDVFWAAGELLSLLAAERDAALRTGGADSAPDYDGLPNVPGGLVM